jgi:OmpA-OmpF porin, OOP family
LNIPAPRTLLILFVVVFLLGVATGTGWTREGDVEDSGDHPLISRYADSVITYHEVTKFDEYILPLGELDKNRELTDSKRVTGKVTRIQYKAPEDVSTLEIYHNYETALRDAGFEILFSGTQQELGWFWPYKLYDRDINPLTIEGNRAISEDDFRYLSAKLDRRQEDEGIVYVSLCVAGHQDDSPGIQVDVIETRPMEKEKVEVRTDADVLAEEIHGTGVASIQDLYFDTGKATIKPESRPAIEEIAQFLKQEADLSLYIVGHTDSKGNIDYNMNLSRRRAEAIVEALVENYGIGCDRLQPYGVGPLAPTATNETEDGRAQNRRVELVKP